MLGSSTQARSQRTSTRSTSRSRCLRLRPTSLRSAKPKRSPKTKPSSRKLSRRSNPKRTIGSRGPNRRVRLPNTSRVHPMRKNRRSQKRPNLNLKSPMTRLPKRLSLRNSNSASLPVVAVVAESKSRAARKKKTPPTNQKKTTMKVKSLSAHGTSIVSFATMGAT